MVEKCNYHRHQSLQQNIDHHLDSHKLAVTVTLAMSMARSSRSSEGGESDGCLYLVWNRTGSDVSSRGYRAIN